MIVAVLKNRLLQLTNRQFREEDFGASSLLELLPRYRDLVAVDHSTRPVVIEWLGAGAVNGNSSAHAGRIRPDLWRATLDFSSGLSYAWDAAAQCARPVKDADPGLRIPTVDAATLATWRDAFVQAHEPVLADPAEQDQLRDWAARSLGSQGLPRALRAAWNDHLKSEVIARLTAWFATTEHPLPKLLVK